jgi:hypothetical protein
MAIFKKIRHLFTGKEDQVETKKEEVVFTKILSKSAEEWQQKSQPHSPIDFREISVFQEEVTKWAVSKRIAFIVFSLKTVADFQPRRYRSFSQSQETRVSYVADAYVTYLLKLKLPLTDQGIQQLISGFTKYQKSDWAGVFSWPIGAFLNQVQRQWSDKKLSPSSLKALESLKMAINKVNIHQERDKDKLFKKLETFLHNQIYGKDTIKPIKFKGKDAFAEYANKYLKELPQTDQQSWYRILNHADTAKGSKPTLKFKKATKTLLKELKTSTFLPVFHDFMTFLTQLKDKQKTHTTLHALRSYEYITTTYLATPTADIIKGLVWISIEVAEEQTIQCLALLAERCYRKIPGKGPAAAGLGNACIQALAQVGNSKSLALLSRLKLKIKQANAQKLIIRLLDDAAQKTGISLFEIEEQSVPDFNLQQRVLSIPVSEYKAVLEIVGIGKVNLYWENADGKKQKSIPSSIKASKAERIREIKFTKKEIEKTLSTQRDQMDRIFRNNRSWEYQTWKKYYLDHGITSYLTQQLIWQFTDVGKVKEAIFHENKWVDNLGEEVHPATNSTIQLWHPVFVQQEEVQRWRTFLINHQIQQPFKQAFREIYLLTPAEIATENYSNRMASHILKQHQFNSLAKGRGWRYSLMGAFDDGREMETASITLPAFDIKAEYWLAEVNADDAFNETGIWNYVSTDQVRFINANTSQVIPLAEVPKIVLSEVLRDVDLFVGVASVGNDPNWVDGGLQEHRNYWMNYSFGNLSSIANNRKEVLEGLIPRLKIRDIAEVTDRFVVVKGKLRTYKIHIGSTNILMEPNDQYLCIVPDRKQHKGQQGVFLPFSGDQGLSVIISKALLLAEDDKITDKTITRQILRK